MARLKQPGGTVWVAEAPDWSSRDPQAIRKIAVSKATLTSQAKRGLRAQMGQMYGIVIPGLIHTAHVFRGLKRGMMVGDDGDAASSKLVFSWAPKHDAYLEGSAHDAHLRKDPVPPGTVFVVYASLNEMVSDFPDIYGWAEHWTWVAADSSTPGAPEGWRHRYDERLWSAAA